MTNKKQPSEKSLKIAHQVDVIYEIISEVDAKNREQHSAAWHDITTACHMIMSEVRSLDDAQAPMVVTLPRPTKDGQTFTVKNLNDRKMIAQSYGDAQAPVSGREVNEQARIHAENLALTTPYGMTEIAKESAAANFKSGARWALSKRQETRKRLSDSGNMCAPDDEIGEALEECLQDAKDF